MAISDNKRIAKNTIYLYIRTIIVLFISLYTSRVVLQVLGANDLGIYNVVGGIIALMSFFQAAQTKATSRFITYELGKNSVAEKLKKVFSVCMSIHILTAIVAVILAETVGLWIILHWTNIPIDRQLASVFVYQFSILVFCVQLIRIPYDSIIVAHEDMSIYAYFSILEVVLQLVLVLSVKEFRVDSLILYAGLMAFSSFILLLSYYIYVRKKFPVYTFRFLWDKEYSRRILSFSSWTLLGTSANTATQQGVSLLMNNFVGLVANAALGFSAQVNIAVSKFVNGFSTAFTPQIIKLYAQNDFSGLHSLMFRSSKFSFALCYIMALPLIINMDFILHLWLGNNVPQYTSEFCSLILICTIIDATTGVYNTTITATGNIKQYQLFISLSFLLDLICCSIMLMCEINPIYVFGSRIFTRGIINMFIGLYYVKRYVNFNIVQYSNEVLLKIFYTLLFTIIPIYYIAKITDGWVQLISTGFFSFILDSFCVFMFIMSHSERNIVLKKINLKK